MATKNIYVNQDFNKQEIQNVSIEKLANDPSGLGLYAGRIWVNTTDLRTKWYDGVAIHTLAHKSDLEAFGALVSLHDASTGIPTVGSGDAGAIRKGDYWIISVGGTITGLSGNSAILQAGDLIYAAVDGASAAASFYGVQANLNLPGNIAQAEIVTLATLTANTATAIPTTFTNNVYSVQVFNSANEDITSGLHINSTNQITSNVALTGLTIRVIGN